MKQPNKREAKPTTSKRKPATPAEAEPTAETRGEGGETKPPARRRDREDRIKTKPMPAIRLSPDWIVEKDPRRA
ncbi:MAG: hypothetical protein U1F43_09975 [Myxococcota bacterium]